jgi:hypothetical protein
MDMERHWNAAVGRLHVHDFYSEAIFVVEK